MRHIPFSLGRRLYLAPPPPLGLSTGLEAAYPTTPSASDGRVLLPLTGAAPAAGGGGGGPGGRLFISHMDVITMLSGSSAGSVTAGEV